MSVSSPVSLRPLAAPDLPRVAAWGDDPQIEFHFGKVFATEEEREEFIHQKLHRERCAMAIELPDAGLIGVIEAVNLNWRERSGEMCVFIGEEQFRGRGYGTAAVALFVEMAFDRLGLERMYLRVARSNLRARKCYEKNGFRPRGSLPPSRRQPERTEELLLMEMRRVDLARLRYLAGG